MPFQEWTVPVCGRNSGYCGDSLPSGPQPTVRPPAWPEGRAGVPGRGQRHLVLPMAFEWRGEGDTEPVNGAEDGGREAAEGWACSSRVQPLPGGCGCLTPPGQAPLCLLGPVVGCQGFGVPTCLPGVPGLAHCGRGSRQAAQGSLCLWMPRHRRAGPRKLMQVSLGTAELTPCHRLKHKVTGVPGALHSEGLQQ